MEHPSTTRGPPATPKKHRESQRARTTAAASSPPAPASSSRCTRSQAAPDWTTYESLVLVGEIAAMAEDWLKALSSYQKWKMISDNCATLRVVRSSNQCRRRRESLHAGYRRIREWEARHGEGSYWSLAGERKQQLELPAWFDQEIFGCMDAVMKPQESRLRPGNANPENLIHPASQDIPVTAEVEMQDVNDSHGSKANIEDDVQDSEKVRDIVSKLHDNAQQIHAILGEKLNDNLGLDTALVDLSKRNAAEMELARCQADQLIKAFGRLVGDLNQLTELIRVGDCEGIGHIDTMAS